MRALIFLTGLVVAGCAGQPVQPQPYSIAQAPSSSNTPAANSGVTSPSIEAQRLAAAKNLNLKVFTQDGQQLFCRSNQMTGSHIQRDTTCYTADQVDRMQQATQRDLDTFLMRSEAQNAPTMGPPRSH